MANLNLDVVIKAHDDYTAAFNRFKATATNATSGVASNTAASAAAMNSSWSGALGGMQAAWLKFGVVVAASAWFIAAGKKALEAEVK